MSEDAEKIPSDFLQNEMVQHLVDEEEDSHAMAIDKVSPPRHSSGITIYAEKQEKLVLKKAQVKRGGTKKHLKEDLAPIDEQRHKQTPIDSDSACE